MAFLPQIIGGAKGVADWAGGAQDLTNPVQPGQLQDAYGNTQNALGQQAAFLQALQAQGGLQNQSNVFNQLQGVANGTGPNPAMAMLNQQTGNNVAQQAALMAGQRGTNANAGLLARQIGQQGAGIQQQAVGQGAALGAQQQLGALNQLGGLANQQVAQQQAGLNAYQTGALQGQQNLLGATGNFNNAQVSQGSNLAKGRQGLLGGIGNAAMMLASGGEVPGPRSSIGRMAKGISMESGGHVPGKAEVKGDSLKNDKVPAVLSPGEVVIPRSVMNSKDPAAEAAKFVAAVLAKKGRK